MRTLANIKDVLIPFLQNIAEDCILYPYLKKDGYGDIQYRTPDGKKRHYLAHRLSYEIYNNMSLSPDQLVLHSCDVPNCINPKHLRVGTHKDNSDDKVSRCRQAKGEQNGRYIHGYHSKFEPKPKPITPFESLYSRSLSRDQVLLIKEAIRNKGSKSFKQISSEFGIKYHIIADINNNRAYKDM